MKHEENIFILVRNILASSGQVEKQWAVDGYCNFWSVSEWWNMKTRFTQWYTKSFSSQFLPFAAELRLSPGHAP